MMRLRRHENEQDQPVGARIGDAVPLSGNGQRRLAGPELFILGRDFEASPSFDDVINFVGAFMTVRGLRLSGFETVNIAKKPRCLEKTVLLHLVRRKLP